jgi:hypothetical protein
MDQHLLDRAAIRELVRQQMPRVEEARRRGENEHQVELDLNDDFLRKLSGYSDEDRSTLKAIYAEEKLAVANKIIDTAVGQQLNAIQTEAQVYDIANALGWIVAIIIGIVMIAGMAQG